MHRTKFNKLGVFQFRRVRKENKKMYTKLKNINFGWKRNFELIYYYQFGEDQKYYNFEIFLIIIYK